MKRILAVMAALACAGCVAPPATIIKGSLAGVPFYLKSPKEIAIENLNLMVVSNAVTLSIARLGSTNSPQVIQTTAAAQVDMINAVGAQVQQAVATGMKAAAKP